MHIDLNVGPVPAFASVAPPPECTVTLGTIEGRVRITGQPAPDGTVVVTTTDTMVSLEQAVVTKGGSYQVPSVGEQCVGKAAQYFPTRLAVAGTVSALTPSQEHVVRDLPAPLPPTARGRS
jgi:hypothetical protein